MNVPRWAGLAVRLAATVALAVPAGLSIASPARAEHPPSCGNVTQIGNTAYIDIGETFASVKQFKGCGRNWAYGYVWESFRNRHSAWTLCVSVRVGANKPYDWLGGRCTTGSRGVEVWSAGTDTLDKCTAAEGQGPVILDRTPTAVTDVRC